MFILYFFSLFYSTTNSIYLFQFIFLPLTILSLAKVAMGISIFNLIHYRVIYKITIPTFFNPYFNENSSFTEAQHGELLMVCPNIKITFNHGTRLKEFATKEKVSAMTYGLNNFIHKTL